MVRGIHNWTYRDVSSFLRAKGFYLAASRGGHMYFTPGSQTKPKHLVCVPFHGSTPIHPATMKSIIMQSGIDKRIWLRS